MSTNFAERLLNWFEQHGRHDLPWQRPRTPYRVWLSEVMLQQTQVSAVIPYFNRFIERFPDVSSLAIAETDEVLHLWSGLGYYARARNLHRAARIIHQQYNSLFPEQEDALATLPGIGRSTAAAIIAQAFNRPATILDGNVKRVIARYFMIDGWVGKSEVLKAYWLKAESLTPQQHAADYTQAIMDLGSTVCTRTQPACERCPVAADCAANIHNCTPLYPTKKPKKNLPIRQTCMLIIQNDKQDILLFKRPPAGIWGGLWSLPEVSHDSDIPHFCQQQFGIQVAAQTSLERLRHTFSHYHLDIDPVLITTNNPANVVLESGECLWYNSKHPDKIGLPKPVSQLINANVKH